jgi:hypothetical protein
MCAPGLGWESLLRLCMPVNLVGCQSSKSFEPASGIFENFFSNKKIIFLKLHRRENGFRHILVLQ